MDSLRLDLPPRARRPDRHHCHGTRHADDGPGRRRAVACGTGRPMAGPLQGAARRLVCLCAVRAPADRAGAPISDRPATLAAPPADPAARGRPNRGRQGSGLRRRRQCLPAGTLRPRHDSQRRPQLRGHDRVGDARRLPPAGSAAKGNSFAGANGRGQGIRRADPKRRGTGRADRDRVCRCAGQLRAPGDFARALSPSARRWHGWKRASAARSCVCTAASSCASTASSASRLPATADAGSC